MFLGSLTQSQSADYKKGFSAFLASDYLTAFRIWKPLANNGHRMAQNSLGSMYYLGRGVRQDYQAALKWFTRAAKNGHRGAQDNLGTMYRKGIGVQKNYRTAAKWFTRAAKQGHPNAQYFLGYFYDIMLIFSDKLV